MKRLVLLIGYAAMAVGMTFMLPQVVKSWKTKRVDDLSLASVTLYFANSILWLTYGLLIAAWPVAIANALALAVGFHSSPTRAICQASGIGWRIPASALAQALP